MADNSNIIKTITVNDVTCDVAGKYDVDGNVIKDTYVQKDGSNVTVDNLQVNNSISIKNPVNESYTEFASLDGSKLTIGTTEASRVDIIGGTASGIRLKSDTIYLGDTVKVFEAHPDKVVKVGADSYILQLKSAEQPTWGDKTLAMKSELDNYLSLSGGKMTGNINLNGNKITGDYQANKDVNIIGLSSTQGLLVGNDVVNTILVGPRPKHRATISGVGEALEEIAYLSDIIDPSGNVISTTYLNKNTDGIMNGSLTVNNDTLFGHADGTSEHNFRGEIYTSYAINLNGGDVTLNGNDDNTRLTVNGEEVAHLSDIPTDYIPKANIVHTFSGGQTGSVASSHGVYMGLNKKADILYQHNLHFSTGTIPVAYLTIFNNDNTKFTETTLLSHLANKGHNSVETAYSCCFGCLSTGGIILGFFTKDNLLYYVSEKGQDSYISTNITINDTVYKL